MIKKFVLLVLLFGALVARSQEIQFPKLESWINDGKVQHFNKDNLFEHIDGAAEFYLSFGFEALHVASFKQGAAEFTIEVYEQTNDLLAYGIYSNEKSPKAEVAKVGLEGYGDASTFIFVAGKYYVKMNGTKLEEVKGFSLRDIAKKFAADICANPVYPKVIALFPTENMVANSCQYIPSEFMGLGFMGSAVRAKYTLAGGEPTLFILQRENSGEVEQIIKKYVSYAEAKVKKIAEGDFLLKDPFNGTVLLRWKGNFLIGVSGFADKGKATSLLDQVSSKL